MKRLVVIALCAAGLVLAAPAVALGAHSLRFTIKKFEPTPNHFEFLEGPCGAAVDSHADLYVSDYYHDKIDVFSSTGTFITQISGIDPLDGPCGLAVDGNGRIYVNTYHGAVLELTPAAYPPAKGTTYSPPVAVIGGVEATGIALDPASGNLLVDERTSLAEYEAPVTPGAEPLRRVGTGSLEDGYGVAASGYPGNEGFVYVADAASSTVKVYDPATSLTEPVAAIDGEATAAGRFGGLTDGALALDDSDGHLYVGDAAEGLLFEHPKLTVEEFDATGQLVDELEPTAIDGEPSGIAVDDSGLGTQGDLYVTDGNSEESRVLAFGPTVAAAPVLEPAPAAITDTNEVGGTDAPYVSRDCAAGAAGSVCSAAGRRPCRRPRSNSRKLQGSGRTDLPEEHQGERTDLRRGSKRGEPRPAEAGCTPVQQGRRRPARNHRRTARGSPSERRPRAPRALADQGGQARELLQRHRRQAARRGKGEGFAPGRPFDQHGRRRQRARLRIRLPLLPSRTGEVHLSRSSAGVVQHGNLRVGLTAAIAPRALPRHGRAPVSVAIGAKIGTADGSVPPQLRRLRIEINREGRLETAGLPKCPLRAIQPASSSRALAACHSSLVGSGHLSASVALPQLAPFPSSGRILAFNGSYKGHPAILAHVYGTHPFPTSYTLPFTISRAKGRFGTVLSASLPQATGEWGFVNGISLKLSRTYQYRGHRRAYLSAGCPAPPGIRIAPFPLTRASFFFAGGRTLTSTVNSSCRVRG